MVDRPGTGTPPVDHLDRVQVRRRRGDHEVGRCQTAGDDVDMAMAGRRCAMNRKLP